MIFHTITISVEQLSLTRHRANDGPTSQKVDPVLAQCLRCGLNVVAQGHILSLLVTGEGAFSDNGKRQWRRLAS